MPETMTRTLYYAAVEPPNGQCMDENWRLLALVSRPFTSKKKAEELLEQWKIKHPRLGWRYRVVEIEE